MNPHTRITLVLLILGFGTTALAIGHGALGWGSRSIFLPDGSVQIWMVTDGGFADAGFADGGWGFDGGQLTYDGGVCADGGTSCQACQGSCLSDAGFLDGGPIDGGPVDGGWIVGPSSGLVCSDPVQTSQSFKTTAQCSGPINASIYATFQLQGSTDVKNPGVWLPYPNSSFSMVVLDGGQTGAVGGIIQGQGQVASWTQVCETANAADGGYCGFTYEAQ